MGQEPDDTLDQDDPTPDPEPQPDPKPDPVDGLDEAALRAELKKTREEAAKNRVAAREARDKVKEYEDKDKSEAQKLQERAEAAEARAAQAERDSMVAKVALSKGLTETQAKRLTGSTMEELEADADELLEMFKPNDAGGQEPPRTTRERLRPGAVPSAEEEENDPRKLAAQVPRRY